jgi:hypothetical protein
MNSFKLAVRIGKELQDLVKKEVKSKFTFSSSLETNVTESSPPKELRVEVEETKSDANESINDNSQDEEPEIIEIEDIDDNQFVKNEDNLDNVKNEVEKPKRRVVSYNLIKLINKHQENEFE